MSIVAALLLSGLLPDGCPDESTLQGRLLLESGTSCPKLDAQKKRQAAVDAAAKGKFLPVVKQNAIKKQFYVMLIDGESARYLWPKQQSAVTYCGFVNSKNRLGGYTGWQQFLVMFEDNGEVGALYMVDEPRDKSPWAVVCDGTGYSPSPSQ